MKNNTHKLFASLSMLVALLSGCGKSQSDFAGLQRDLSLSLARFENAEAHFSSSATYDQLVVNAGWLDRMVEEVVKIERIEARAVSLGSDPIPGIRKEIAQRFRRRLATFQSNAEYLDVMSQLEIAQIWLDI